MHDFTILVARGAFSSGVAATLDLLSAAAAMAPRLKVAAPRWQVRALGAGPVRLSNGLVIDAKPLTDPRKPDGSIWVIPGLATNTAAAVDQRLREADLVKAAKALRSHAGKGGTVAASCSAVFLLQQAGLLVDRKVTTTWWLAAHLKAREARCFVDADRLVIRDGSIWTAGAAFAHTDLMVQLLRARCGSELADAVTRVLLIDGREAQAPFVIPAMLSNGDSFVARITAQIEASLPKVVGVSDLARLHCMSERTLMRRIQAATGKSPSTLIQFVRLRRARMLLETSRLSVDRVAERVGYRDSTALRRLMRKAFGATPRQFRQHSR